MGIVMTDEQLDGKVAKMLEELRRAVFEATPVARDIQRHREALADIGAKAERLVLRDENSLGCGELAVEPWPTHNQVVTALRRDRRLHERITELRGRLRQMGIGPDLFE